MKNLREYIDFLDSDKKDDLRPAVVAIGRYNPPTIAHRMIFQETVDMAERLDARPVIVIIDSERYDSRNPLSGQVRKEFIEEMYSNLTVVVAKNAFDGVLHLYEDHDMVAVGGVVGIDRQHEYKAMVGRIHGEKAMDIYETKVIHRDPDASNDVSGISATRARRAALENDESTFRALTMTNHEKGTELMRLIRRSSGIE